MDQMDLHAQAAPSAAPMEPHPPATNTAVTFSEPELGMASLSEAQAKQAGLDVGVARYDFQQDARAQIAGRDSGMLKIVFDKSSHKVLGGVVPVLSSFTRHRKPVLRCTPNGTGPSFSLQRS